MPHDPLFEKRIANALAAHGAKAEPKKMFGGVAFMVKGNMSLGITNKNDMMVRFDGSRHEEILEWPGAKPMTYGHKNMTGFVFVEADAVSGKAALDKWVKLSLAYVNTLPDKAMKATIKRTISSKAGKPVKKNAASKRMTR
jgi:TfoX/Sxy family transcriptional regulator of competence genes